MRPKRSTSQRTALTSEFAVSERGNAVACHKRATPVRDGAAARRYLRTVPSIEVDEATMQKLQYEADRRGITVEMMTKVFVQFAIDEANARVAAMSTVECPDPSPEFVARAMEHGEADG